MGKLPRRAFLFASGATLGALGMRAWGPERASLKGTTSLRPSGGPGVLNDASRLSETPVHRHITLRQDPGTTLVDALRAELKDAQANNRPVNIGAARHSMGGHAIPRAGHAITYASDWVEADRDAGLYQTHAGARWSQVIAKLDPLGLSPKVMQSNNDFGVASTFCVNAHGWPAPHGPMGATVREIEMLLADGELVNCSRTQNSDLFRLTMGGYGLTGLITKLTVEAAPNTRLEPVFTKLKGADFGPAMAKALADPAVDMAYGRMNVDRARFFEDALLITYHPTADQQTLPPAASSGAVSKVARHVFRAQLGNERVKRLRWGVETGLAPKLTDATATRNSLINEPVVTLDDRDPNRTDILHEYFIAPDRFADFLTASQEVIPGSFQELLNITLRYVAADPESILSYAPGPRIAAVMLFSQEMTARGEADMARMTRILIDRVIAIGGSYYLPYRPHATKAQLRAAYPQVADFAIAKRAIDPQLRLRNGFWDRYLEDI